MQNQDFHTDLGGIKIHKNVIASIASVAALEVEGVVRVGADFKSGLLELMCKKALPAIKVEIDKHDEIRLDIPLVVKYDFNIPEVSGKVQENVRNALERMTDLAIKDINISIQGVERGQ